MEWQPIQRSTSLFHRCQDLQHRDRGSIVAEDDAQSAVARLRTVEAEPASQLGAGGDLQEGRRLDSTQDVVVDQYAAQRRLYFQDGLAHRSRAAGQVDADDAELDDSLGFR